MFKLLDISHVSKFMLKILQARFREYVKWKIPDVQAGFRKGKGTRGQTANIRWIIEKARVMNKNLCPHKHMDVYSNFIGNCQNLEATKISSSR